MGIKTGVAYLCDGKDPKCMGKLGCSVNNIEGNCRYTLDISHARNFEYVGEHGINKWVETGRYDGILDNCRKE